MDQLPAEFLSLLDVQDAPFVLIDSEYRIIAANQSYCENYGVRREEVVGRRCHEVSHRSPIPCHQAGEDCPHQKVFATGRAYHVLHTHYDHAGRPEHVRIKGHPIEGSNGKRYLGESVVRIASVADVDSDSLRMVGRAPAFLACVDHLTRAAESEAPVLLYGESGVGKELAARYVHRRSSRAKSSFVALDCASIPESLFETELFGHEPGAFTGSVGRKKGLFELADGGTLFLDEIGEVPLSMQPKLLRVLATGEFRRIGGKTLLKADVRIISATNRNLLDMVGRGIFRQDLYYRIAGIDVALPPLRSRRTDIPALAEALLKTIRDDRPFRYRIADEALRKLLDYDYPGNVRELRNILQKAAALTQDGLIKNEHLRLDIGVPAYVTSNPEPSKQGPEATHSPKIAELEKDYIERLLARHNGHRRTVADVLGISERTLYRKLNRYGLQGRR